MPPSSPLPSFDRLAGLYRWMEFATFGPWLGRCRYAFLDELGASRRALILGDGDGRFTARLLAANQHVHLDAVDASPAMLAQLARRADSHAARLRTYKADARLWQPANPPYDLIVTHFFLDCLTTEEVEALAAKLRASVSPGALWVVSEFAIPTGRFGRWIAGPIVRALYWAFGLLTGLTVRSLPSHRTALAHAGFTLGKRRSGLCGMLVSELWSWEEISGGR
jgi:SAM-dependent methyltransferase